MLRRYVDKHLSAKVDFDFCAQPVLIKENVFQLFNEGRALETQGNMAAAQRLYSKVTKISPRVSYQAELYDGVTF